ncbi:hypothetical protein ASE92_11930 [Pedobacter sp. Leaf41]|uniref:hypothetical protein n=1 Tax=Pedobacter sp. Leaf41 TaxID=1736218 RepID=UPI0007025B35|nr:hypothetical protein [Pedobacter sp. Leaf41]KQN34313.1 hypothetical protein ASE92_11930 [Pedobacter sp. Leaf41]
MEENKDKAEGNLHLNDVEKPVKRANAYENLSRGLTVDELAQTGTQKLILNDLSKAERTIELLEPFRDMYYTETTEKRVLEEKLTKTKRAEILYSFSTASGGVILGMGKMYLETKGNLAFFMMGIGILLILGGVAFKISFKK